MVKAVEECGFFESIPLWAVTLIGSLVITVLSFVVILTVYGRFFKLYIYTALSPLPFATFAGEPSQAIGVNFLKSYAGVCLEGAVIILACVIFSAFAASPPASAVSFGPEFWLGGFWREPPLHNCKCHRWKNLQLGPFPTLPP